MNKLLVSLLLTLGVTGVAQAAGTALVGDAAAGQAKTAVCGACHGPDGNSMAPNFPKLAGQGDRYLLKQLHEIKDGKRQVLEMTGLLANLNDQDLADIAAYFTGRAFGRRKLAPSISPGKSWEGAYGAVVGVAVYGLACLSYIGYPLGEPGRLVLALVGLVAFTAVSIIGDLFESMVKRQAGVKDSGTLLPGHGGILDRIDSLTSTLPLAALVVLWIAK